jgi:hypothetical protein
MSINILNITSGELKAFCEKNKMNMPEQQN